MRTNFIYLTRCATFTQASDTLEAEPNHAHKRRQLTNVIFINNKNNKKFRGFRIDILKIFVFITLFWKIAFGAKVGNSECLK